MASKSAQIQVIAKIEKPEALENLNEIVEASDALMIARGDLGVEIGNEKVPFVQKKLIKMIKSSNRKHYFINKKNTLSFFNSFNC